MSHRSSRPMFRRASRIESARQVRRFDGDFFSEEPKRDGLRTRVTACKLARRAKSETRLFTVFHNIADQGGSARKTIKRLLFALPLKFVRFSAQIILIRALKSTKQCIRAARCRLYCIRSQGVIFAPLLSTDATRRASRVEIPGQTGHFCSIFFSGKAIKGRVLLTGQRRTGGLLLVFRNEVDRWGPAWKTAQRPRGPSFLPPKLSRSSRKNSYL